MCVCVCVCLCVCVYTTLKQHVSKQAWDSPYSLPTAVVIVEAAFKKNSSFGVPKLWWEKPSPIKSASAMYCRKEINLCDISPMTCWTFLNEVIFYFIYFWAMSGGMWDSSSQPWTEPAPPAVELWSPDCQGSSWNFLLLQLNLAYPDWYILAPILDSTSWLQLLISSLSSNTYVTSF